MSKSQHQSLTPATQWLKEHKIPFEEKSYEYVEHGGTALAASACGLDHHHVIKTLVMEDENKKPLIILMHGDCEVSTKNLARQIGVKHVAPCKPEQAQRNSGYFVGGTSPFGTKKKMPVYVEDTILELDHIFINGGRRGYQVGIDPKVLTDVLGAGALREPGITPAIPFPKTHKGIHLQTNAFVFFRESRPSDQWQGDPTRRLSWHQKKPGEIPSQMKYVPPAARRSNQ